MKQENKETLKKGDKYRITDSMMKHLIGKIVTIKGFKFSVHSRNFYEVTIDDMNDCSLVCSERTLEKL